MIVENSNDIFKQGKKQYINLLNLYNTITSINVNLLYDDWLTDNKLIEQCTKDWENTLLTTGKPDYSIYGRTEYLNEAYISWTNYSREYVKRLKKFCISNNNLNSSEITSVIDLGCGIAYTTIALSNIFPNAMIYGTNEPNTPQIELDKLVTSNFDNIEILDDNFKLKNHIDVIVGFEFFEHLEKPIEFLLNLINQYTPTYIIFANTFNKMATGHFVYYDVFGNTVHGSKLSRIFSKTLKENNYQRIETHFFNNRPYIYRYCDNIKPNLF